MIIDFIFLIIQIKICDADTLYFLAFLNYRGKILIHNIRNLLKKINLIQ